MRRYDSYKDSGVEWLGDVPSHWELKRLKQLFVEKKHKQNLSLNCGAISFGKVIEKDDDKVTEATKRSYQEVLKGEFLINPLNLNYDLISLRIALSEIDVVVSSGYIVLKAKQIINKKYFSYLLHRYDVAYMKLLGSGVRQTINYGHISDSILVAPPLSEQQKIAQFLDNKTAKIDQAVDLAEKQIALLKEHKQILIQNAVTRGLNPDMPLKDSGVEWIGQVPEHWEVKKIKHVTSKIGSGITPLGGGSNYIDGGIPLLRSQNIHFDRIDLNDVARISEFTHNSMKNSKVRKGDVLLNITGGSLGRCFYVDSNEEMNVNQHVCIIRPNKKINTIFLNMLLASEIGQKQIWFFQQGGGREGLNFQAIKNFYLPLPDLEEQQKIAIYLNKQATKIDQAIALKTAHIEKLKEYKSVLINDVVTGKVRVSV